MFGYVVPDKPNMYVKDLLAYKSYYCGLCKSLGAEYGQKERFCTNYDCTFLSVFLHNLLDYQPKTEDKTCILNPIRKKAIIKNDDISSKVASVTVLLGYYKAEDDVIDEGGAKTRAARSALKKAKRKAAKKMPEIDALIKEKYSALRELEKSGECSFDKTAEPFCEMLEGIIKIIAADKADDNSLKLIGCIGKWVYAMDAADDIDEDLKAGRYNPLIASLGTTHSKKEFLKKHNSELGFILYSAYDAVVKCYDKAVVRVSEGVLSNIIYLGLKMQTENMLKGAEKCNKIRM